VAPSIFVQVAVENALVKSLLEDLLVKIEGYEFLNSSKNPIYIHSYLGSRGIYKTFLVPQVQPAAFAAWMSKVLMSPIF